MCSIEQPLGSERHAKIAYITAIYGSYEATCKPFVPQTVVSDFICFTDNPNMESNGWSIDTNPYHLTYPSPIDTGEYTNSIAKNKHTFNIAKYYKQSFQQIPRLREYDIVVWLDGTLELIYSRISEWLLRMIPSKSVIGWEHECRQGVLKEEVIASNCDRYTSTWYFNQPQPYQDVNLQYEEYVKDGYDESLWKRIDPTRKHFGVWITCFVAFHNKKKEVSDFLNHWYLQTLQYTTQDQIGFPYTVQKTKLIPYTLPDEIIWGERPHFFTEFYIKHTHGK